jgi:hypothetical protein
VLEACSRSSVLRDHRAAPVEAPDQLAADGLYEFVRIDESAVAPARRKELRETLGLVVRIPVFGLPEQARGPSDCIFVAGADEPAMLGLRRKKETSGSTAELIDEIDLIEMRLRVASGHVREQLRHHDIAQSAASSPFPTKKTSHAHYYLCEAEHRHAREPLLHLLPHLVETTSRGHCA